MKITGFVGPSAPSQSPIADCERTVNYYVEPLSQTARSRAALYPSPGFSTLSTVSQVGGRALYEMNDLCFGVWGSQAYNIPSTFVPTSIGTMTQDQYEAQIVSNGAGSQFAAYAIVELRGCRKFSFEFEQSDNVGMNALWAPV